MPLPPHMLDRPPPDTVTHEDLAELINTKFERLFTELEKIKVKLG